uniref:ZP domain-containing protein n=1 Tax=Timema monikensis TaxID=170555 RepID=A0A7R9EER7_9NEOP|nr:unnamed protein product [Timema monikensis]
MHPRLGVWLRKSDGEWKGVVFNVENIQTYRTESRAWFQRISYGPQKTFRTPCPQKPPARERQLRIAVLDDRGKGCPIQPDIITQFKYNSKKGVADATLRSMFKFQDSSEVHFQCDIAICKENPTSFAFSSGICFFLGRLSILISHSSHSSIPASSDSLTDDSRLLKINPNKNVVAKVNILFSTSSASPILSTFSFWSSIVLKKQITSEPRIATTCQYSHRSSAYGLLCLFGSPLHSQKRKKDDDRPPCPALPCVRADSTTALSTRIYGFPPRIKSHLEFIRKNTSRTSHSTLQLQSIASDVCGHYCLMYLLYRAQNIPMKTFQSVFSPTNHSANDAKVVIYYNTIFKTVGSCHPSRGCVQAACA